MASASYQEIKDSLRELYLDDQRPWLVGFSGGKQRVEVSVRIAAEEYDVGTLRAMTYTTR